MTDEKLNKLVREHFWSVLGEEGKPLRRLASQVRFDLYFGPGTQEENDPGDDGPVYPGFEAGTNTLSEKLKFSDIWVDTQAELVCESRPEPWTDDDGDTHEPCWEDYTHLSAEDVKRIVLDVVAKYL